MKNITSRLIGALVAIHLALAYIIGFAIEPFAYSLGYLLGMVPVIVILIIAYYRLNLVFHDYKYDGLGTKMRIAAKKPWVWILVLAATLLVISIMWYGGQSLRPTEEIVPDITFNGDARMGNIICWGICTLFYVINIIGLYKTLKKILNQ